jgi:hypothetical protein
MIMSLRDGALPSKQSLVARGDCFATCARNDMQTASLREPHKGVILQSQTQEDLEANLATPWVGG